MNTEQKSKLARLREVYLRAEMKSIKKKYETDSHFRAIVDSGVKATIERFEKESIDNMQVSSNERQESKNHFVLSQIKNIRNYLADLSKDKARELADLSDLTLSYYRNVAKEAPIYEMSTTNRKRFQLPIDIYFRKMSLPEDLVKLWSNATLSFKQCSNGLQLVLQSAPDNFALVVSTDSDREITLNKSNFKVTIPYDEDKIDQLRIGLFPFRTDE